jgi:membrane-bound lytic murein transglycosylase B
MFESKHKKVLAIATTLVLVIGGVLLIWTLKNPKEPILVEVSPSISPSPSPIEIPTPTPSIVVSPFNARLSYVQQELLSAGFNVQDIQKIISDQRIKKYPVKEVIYRAPNWQLIEDKLYSSTFVQMGKEYIKAHQAAFDKAEADFGVPKEVLAGIIAIETEFGKSSGATPTFNALYSRMEQWPEEKWKSQASQLIALAKYCLNSGKDCFEIKGSYAGAIGIVQFMPYSLLTWGIDGNLDGEINLYDPVDALPSAANFLIKHGWNDDQLKAIAGYYGSSIGYPAIVLKYAELLKK